MAGLNPAPTPVLGPWRPSTPLLARDARARGPVARPAPRSQPARPPPLPLSLRGGSRLSALALLPLSRCTVGSACQRLPPFFSTKPGAPLGAFIPLQTQIDGGHQSGLHQAALTQGVNARMRAPSMPLLAL